MKTKFATVIALLIMALAVLSGCSTSKSSFSSKEKQGQSESNNIDVSGLTFGVCIYQLSDNFMHQFSDETVKYLTSLGVPDSNITVCDAENNKDTQLSQVEKLIEEKVDALIINPVNTGIVHTMTDKASASGIPVIYINREPEASEEIRWEDYSLNVTYVGCDARQSGIYQGELLLELGISVIDKNSDNSIRYFLIEGAPENIDARYRSEYSVATLNNEGWNMDCLYTAVADWDSIKAKEMVGNALTTYPDVELIICNNDAMAMGAIEALGAHGLTPGKDVYVIGVDALPQAISMVEDGRLVGTVFNDYISQSHSAVDAALRYIEGKSNEHFIGCDYIKVNKENAKDILKLIQE